MQKFLPKKCWLQPMYTCQVSPDEHGAVVAATVAAVAVIATTKAKARPAVNMAMGIVV
jgi:hypothetical protein